MFILPEAVSYRGGYRTTLHLLLSAEATLTGGCYSPVSGNASDELSQGSMSLRLLSGGMMGVPPPPHMLRPPLNLSQTVCDTPLSSRFSAKRKSPSMENSLRRSPPQYLHRHAPPPPPHSSSYAPATPTSVNLGPTYVHSRRSYPNSSCKSPRYRKSPVLNVSYKGTPINGRTSRGSPKSGGPSPNSPPPGKLRHCYSSPELMTTSSPDENVPQNFISSGAQTSTPPLTCEICNKTFTSRSNLNKHVRVQHSGEEYACQFCQRTFKNRYYIKEHTSLCVTANQKKVAAAAAAAAAVAGAISSSPCPPASIVNSYSSMSAMTPPAHPAAMMPAPALHAAAAPLDLHKFEPPDYDEQPTDLAIHGRSSSPSQTH
ncbi:Zinc finger C2H2-type [Trinorchestia longiramus]|nr:Zinc finger C2H2-type [Trinorchestia longiramus]